MRKPRYIRLPDIRTDDDCRRLIATLKKPVYRGCFTLVYAYGLRIGETIKLPVTAVDSKQLLLRVIAKGTKERALPLPESMLAMLRAVWKSANRHSAFLRHRANCFHQSEKRVWL